MLKDHDRKEQLWIKEPFSRIMNKKMAKVQIKGKKYIIFNRAKHHRRRSCMQYVVCFYATNYEHGKLCSCFPMMIKLQHFPSLLNTHVQTLIEFMGYWMIYQQKEKRFSFHDNPLKLQLLYVFQIWISKIKSQIMQKHTNIWTIWSFIKFKVNWA